MIHGINLRSNPQLRNLIPFYHARLYHARRHLLPLSNSPQNPSKSFKARLRPWAVFMKLIKFAGRYFWSRWQCVRDEVVDTGMDGSTNNTHAIVLRACSFASASQSHYLPDSQTPLFTSVPFRTHSTMPCIGVQSPPAAWSSSSSPDWPSIESSSKTKEAVAADGSQSDQIPAGFAHDQFSSGPSASTSECWEASAHWRY